MRWLVPVAFAAVLLVGCGGGGNSGGATTNPGGGTTGGNTGGNNGTPSPVPPAVISTSPANGETVAVDSQIEVTFSKPMKLSSFSTALDGLGTGYTAVCVDDPDCKTIRFTRQTHLEYNTTYKLTLLAQVRDQEENLLPSPYPWSFKTKPFASPGTFKTLTLDGGTPLVPDAGECTALAIDSSGTVHIAYYSESAGAPKHAFCPSQSKDCSDPESWTIEFIETPPFPGGQKLGRDINLAIDANDALHVSYRDVSNAATGKKDDGLGVLKYANGVAKLDGSGWTWSPVVVDDSGWGVIDTYIAVHAGVIHISYVEKGSSDGSVPDALSYATCSTSCDLKTSWKIVDNIDQGKDAGAPNHIFVTDSAIHISYYLDGTLKYVRCLTTNNTDCTQQINWIPVVVDDGEGKFDVGRENSLAIDNLGTLHITYRDNTNSLLKYASCSSTDCTQSQNWRNVAIDAAGGSTQIVSNNGALHVSYRDDLNKDLKYANCPKDCLDPSQWSVYTIDAPGEVGWDTYLAVASNGTVHISYRDHGNQTLKYAVGNIPSNP